MEEEIEKDLEAIYTELESQGKEIIRIGSTYDLIQKMYMESKEDIRNLCAKVDSIQAEMSSKLDMLTAMNKEQDRYFMKDCEGKHDKVDVAIGSFIKEVEIKQIELQQSWSKDFSSFKKLVMSEIENKILNKKVIALTGIISIVISAVFSFSAGFIKELLRGHLGK